jgi:hypothetical protein
MWRRYVLSTLEWEGDGAPLIVVLLFPGVGLQREWEWLR